MEYTIREIIERTGRSLEQTDYVSSNPKMLDFRLISGEHYGWNGNKLRFKESVTVMDFEQAVKEFPALAAVKYKSREKFPYFTDNLDLLVEAMNNGETVAVEGGPCLFGTYEVSVFVCVAGVGERMGLNAGASRLDRERRVNRHGIGRSIGRNVS